MTVSQVENKVTSETVSVCVCVCVHVCSSSSSTQDKNSSMPSAPLSPMFYFSLINDLFKQKFFHKNAKNDSQQLNQVGVRCQMGW